MNEKFTVIIPARGGSKGVPKKNLKLIAGFPLIAYSIACALMTKSIKDVIITTDSLKIATVSKKFGGKVPFLRPKSISKDQSTDFEYMTHAIKFYRLNRKKIPNYWVLLRPTTPLRDPLVIEKSINKIKKNKDVSSLVSVHENAESPAKMFRMQKEILHGLSPFDPRPEYYNLPRQSFPKTFIGNGYVDIIKSSTILNEKSFYGSKMLGFKTQDVGEIDLISDIDMINYKINNINSKIYKYLLKYFGHYKK